MGEEDGGLGQKLQTGKKKLSRQSTDGDRQERENEEGRQTGRQAGRQIDRQTEAER